MAILVNVAMMIGPDGTGVGEAVDAVDEAATDGLDASELSLTKTVEQHLPDRPNIGSTMTAQEIMNAAKPIADLGGLPGALRWDVPGSYNGSRGFWELVVDPKTKMILHFLFKSG